MTVLLEQLHGDAPPLGEGRGLGRGVGRERRVGAAGELRAVGVGGGERLRGVVVQPRGPAVGGFGGGDEGGHKAGADLLDSGPPWFPVGGVSCSSKGILDLGERFLH